MKDLAVEVWLVLLLIGLIVIWTLFQQLDGRHKK